MNTVPTRLCLLLIAILAGYFPAVSGNTSSVSQDNNIHFAELRHDSFDLYYRSPFGAVPAGTNLTLRFRTARQDAANVFLRLYIYTPATNATVGPTDTAMTFFETRNEGGTTYDVYTLPLTTPSSPSILYYKFRIVDGSATAFYGDDPADEHDNLRQGGDGIASTNEPFAAFQITVYDPAFATPAWLANANVYQIFPDRFRNGEKTNDYGRPDSSVGNPTLYGQTDAAIAHLNWNESICDPRGASCPNAYGNQFYGGDLKGIADKLDYLKALGFDAVYLNPIFKARSNHRYDADDFMEIDPALGGDAAFTSLISAANAKGIKLILDGVWNHASSDSVYFDRYHRYASDGACESLNSIYRRWFVFNTNNVPCGSGDYTGWFGYDSLAEFVDDSAAVRDFFYRDATDNVTKHWYDRGVSGWRFDVAPDISHDWWHDYRPFAKGYKSDGPLIGEIFPDASQYLAGDQLDGVMNYRFRKNVLGFARGSAGWRDNDNNGQNEIIALPPSQFDRAMKSIREDYPLPAQMAMLNLIDSHDTNRALYVLTLLGDSTGPDGRSIEAKKRLKLAALIQFTWLGAPMVYYGDEAAINAPSLANGGNGPEDDPYNRAPFPWPDEAGSVNVYGPADGEMIYHYAVIASLRKAHPALRTGSIETLLAGDITPSSTDNNTYAFARVLGNDKAVVVLNNGAAGNSASIPVSKYFSNGTRLYDHLNRRSYTVGNGNLNITVAAHSGVVLFNNQRFVAPPRPRLQRSR